MSARWHKYSYSAQIEKRRSILGVIIILVSLVLVHSFVSRFFAATFLVQSSTMEPTVSSGDCLMVNLLYSNDTENQATFSPLTAPKRGDLVLIAPAYPKTYGFPVRSLNAIVSFVTFQRVRPFDSKDTWGERPLIRRLIAFPGDTIYMTNFTLYVKPAGESHFLSEFELSSTDYDIRIDDLPDGWTSGLPFSNSFPEITLGNDEFFALCDNRKASNDSRIWGPVAAERVKGKAILRYWPLNRFGRP
jgi:signal peptidase I